MKKPIVLGGLAAIAAVAGAWFALSGPADPKGNDDGGYRIDRVRPGTYLAMLEPSSANETRGKVKAMPTWGNVTIEDGKLTRLDFGGDQGGAVVSGSVRRGEKRSDVALDAEGRLVLPRLELPAADVRAGLASARGRRSVVPVKAPMPSRALRDGGPP